MLRVTKWRLGTGVSGWEGERLLCYRFDKGHTWRDATYTQIWWGGTGNTVGGGVETNRSSKANVWQGVMDCLSSKRLRMLPVFLFMVLVADSTKHHTRPRMQTREIGSRIEKRGQTSAWRKSNLRYSFKVFTNSWFSHNANILLDFTWNPTYAPATVLAACSCSCTGRIFFSWRHLETIEFRSLIQRHAFVGSDNF